MDVPDCAVVSPVGEDAVKPPAGAKEAIACASRVAQRRAASTPSPVAGRACCAASLLVLWEHSFPPDKPSAQTLTTRSLDLSAQ